MPDTLSWPGTLVADTTTDSPQWPGSPVSNWPGQPVNAPTLPLDERLKQLGVDTAAPEDYFDPKKVPVEVDKWAKSINKAVGEIIPKTLPEIPKAVAGFLTPVVGASEDVKKTYGMVKDWVNGASIDETVKKNIPESQLLKDADKTPAGSQERHDAAAQILLQMGSAAGIVHGIVRPAALKMSPESADVAVPPVQEWPGKPVIDPQAVQSANLEALKAIPKVQDKSQALGIVPQPNPFVKEDVAKVVQGAVKSVRQIGEILTPPNVSDVAGETARTVRDYAGELARKKVMAESELKQAASIFKKTPPQYNLEVIDRIETGQPMGDPLLDAYKDTRRKAFDQRVDQVRALNPNALQDLKDNWFEHIWTPESVAKVAGNAANVPESNPWASMFGKRPLAGSGAFLKQQKIPTLKEGIQLGLVPVTDNPVEMDLLKLHEMDRYVMGHKIMDELKERGVAKFFPIGERPDPGYVPINDKIANVHAPKDWKIVNAKGEEMPGQKVLGKYYAQEDAARIINNYLSPGLRGHVPYDAFRFVGNLMNQVQLGFSAYHGMFTAIDSATSSLALGLEQLARSGGHPVEIARGAGNIAKSFAETPVGSMIENLWRGSKFLKEYSKPGSTNAQLAKIVDSAVAGGARVRMDTFYKTGAIKKFTDSLHKGNYAGAVLRAPFALAEMSSKPLMEYAVPRLKMGIISQNLEYELGKLDEVSKKTGQPITQDIIRKTAVRVIDSVDNRMGQMIYDNLFWNKVLKDGLMASVRSVGWNLGDIRELGGGAWDTLTAPKRAYERLTKGSKLGDNPVVTKRMTYVFALPMMVGTLGAIYQYLKIGEPPRDMQDLFMPRTGRKKPDGTDERVMLPTYMKDIAPLAVATAAEGATGLAKRGFQMAKNKLHPLLTDITQMLDNKDYYGNQIAAQGDPLMTTISKEAAFVFKSFVPFSVKGVQQREGDIPEKVESFFGIMPAAKELTESPAMRRMREIAASRVPAGGRTQEEAERANIAKDIIDKARRGQLKESNDALGQALRDKKITSRQATTIRQKMRTDPRVYTFKHLPMEKREEIYEMATDEEKMLFAPYVKRKAGQ